MIKIKKNKIPTLNKPSFLCDSKINEKLDKIEMYKNMNKSHFACFIGLQVLVNQQWLLVF